MGGTGSLRFSGQCAADEARPEEFKKSDRPLLREWRLSAAAFDHRRSPHYDWRVDDSHRVREEFKARIRGFPRAAPTLLPSLTQEPKAGDGSNAFLALAAGWYN
jgi:hypothetical protein